MKKIFLFVSLLACLSSFSQSINIDSVSMDNDRLIGLKYFKKNVQPIVDKMTIFDSTLTKQFTKDSAVNVRVKSYDAIYILSADSLVTIDYSRAGFKLLLSRQITTDSPTELLMYKVISQNTYGLTLKVYKMVATTVNFTGTLIQSFAPVTISNSPGFTGYLSLSIKGI